MYLSHVCSSNVTLWFQAILNALEIYDNMKETGNPLSLTLTLSLTLARTRTLSLTLTLTLNLTLTLTLTLARCPDHRLPRERRTQGHLYRPSRRGDQPYSSNPNPSPNLTLTLQGHLYRLSRREDQPYSPSPHPVPSPSPSPSP